MCIRDRVWIETEWGKIREVADLYYGVPKNVINCEHTWWYPELDVYKRQQMHCSSALMSQSTFRETPSAMPL